ncbi:uncharacterized protein E0L32_009480 [Thyridium curvatum]|uniref:Uncharacterized protein n=1 Tax=Thyridium curvatum TaxID=1093900 RepID=A0A507AWT3_9PEZI|nr:uncharacterized protein E0L32_009480 [Thyridium curvatum]TPX09288.1 hypothetical protein E0L32_009480 [Thyridium curvatum]
MSSTRPQNQTSLARDDHVTPARSPAQPQDARSTSRPEGEARRTPKPRQGNIPLHPIPTMQAAFAESLQEVTSGTLASKPKLRPGDASFRREQLLDQDKSEGPPAPLWRMRPGQKCHELRKLMAQISFGVYLLLNGLANSDAQVVAILQEHIDEVDEFLEVTLEDFQLAIKELTERIDYLKLPMENMTVFEQMLEDRNFRLQIVEGNVKIEHIISRTTTALVQSVQDVSEGLKCTREFTLYLTEQENGPWRRKKPDIVSIYDAMRGNTGGWFNAFVDLQAKSNTMNALIGKLNGMTAEMDRRAGEVSRRTRFSVRPYTSPAHTPKEIGGASPRETLRESPVESPGASLEGSRPSSQGSAEATPPASPSPKVSVAPPRLSLRFSRLPEERPEGPTYFDLPIRDSLFVKDTLPSFQYTPAQTPEIRKDDSPKVIVEEPETKPEEPETKAEELETKADEAQVELPKQDLSDPASPASGASPPPPTSPKSPKSPAEDGPLYILQPRTYTPLPPAPLPSPRIVEEAAKKHSPAGSRTEVVEEKKKPRNDPSPPPLQEKSSRRRLSASRRREAPEAVRSISSPLLRDSAEKQSIAIQIEGEAATDVRTETGQPTKRTSLRQRVSLKTTPPQSIQVPPRHDPTLQRPTFASPRTYQNYRTFTGPDSAYGSDVDRAAVRSMADPSGVDFSPPVMPGMVPSPQSDQQYFRPVRASPHSPLQQRPHTAGNQTPAFAYHQRNAPSRMGGMSMLSTVSTLNPDAPGDRTLKKKRSAFGWLKKAFSLDEEERAAFEQRKREQQHNLYYDGRSPQFLDGKRIRR